MISRAAAAALSLVLLAGALAKAEGPETVRVKDLPSDFLLPAKLWDQLLPSDKPKTNKDQDEEDNRASVQFADLTVILKEKNTEVLRKPEIRIVFPKGGGQIDLAQWLTGKVGTFYVRFETEGKPIDPSFRAY